jgi:hypothetical protein
MLLMVTKVMPTTARIARRPRTTIRTEPRNLMGFPLAAPGAGCAGK